MNNEKTIIERFHHYTTWLDTLTDIEEARLYQPIAEGKWSAAEIIAHITKWDIHLREVVLPAVRNGEGMTFPDFESFNQQASDYASSGLSFTELLAQAKSARLLLVKELEEMPLDRLKMHLTSNGDTHCPYTGTPYSLLYTVEEFTQHDHHHQQQVRQFLQQHV
ncbi:MAG: DinB family protein [Lysinibacillus sp.]